MGPKRRQSKFVIEEVEDESLWEFLSRTLDEAFIDNIPLDALKDLPKFYMYLFGAFGELFALLVFGYFFWSVYDEGTRQKFISITPSSGNCNPIPKAVSGTFTADENGNWAGTQAFDPSDGIYVIGLTAAHLLFSDYEKIMELAKQQLVALSAESINQNLATNMLVYMSWQFNCDPIQYDYCSNFAGQSFAFTANAQYMFSVTYIDTTISNAKADCLSFSKSNYDLLNAINTGSYSYLSFVKDPTCNTTIVPQHLGYDPVLSGSEFSVNMDVRTLVDSVAVNTGLLDVNGLDPVGNTESFEFEHNGYYYTARYYIDTWYTGMIPLFCAVNNASVVDTTLGVTEICMWLQGNITGIPIFLHYGAGNHPASPKPCDW